MAIYPSRRDRPDPTTTGRTWDPGKDKRSLLDRVKSRSKNVIYLQ